MLLNGPLAPLLRWPSVATWKRCAPIALIAAAVMAAIAIAIGIVQWRPIASPTELFPAALILLFVPAIGEELLFRWLLFPRRTLFRRKILIVVSIAAFVFWHPAQAWFGFGPAWSSMFLEPGFLIVVAVLGVTLSWLRDRSNSLWPPILMHWLVVCAWKFLGGGPF